MGICLQHLSLYKEIQEFLNQEEACGRLDEYNQKSAKEQVAGIIYDRKILRSDNAYFAIAAMYDFWRNSNPQQAAGRKTGRTLWSFTEHFLGVQLASKIKYIPNFVLR